MDQGLKLAIAAAGTKYRLAKLLKITPQALQRWQRIPIGRVVEVEKVTGISRERLRPELYARSS
jgi:DNA-binding transcriptional regulator YdaS (Cro superfamily)